MDRARSSGSGAGLAPNESTTPNSHERITWLNRYASRESLDSSIASRTNAVSGTVSPASAIFRPPLIPVLLVNGESDHGGGFAEQCGNLVIRLLGDH